MYCWCVLNAHGHDNPFVQAPGCVYRREAYVVWVHPSLEETVSHVKGSEHFSLCAVRQDFVDAWYGETVCYSVCI